MLEVAWLIDVIADVVVVLCALVAIALMLTKRIVIQFKEKK